MGHLKIWCFDLFSIMFWNVFNNVLTCFNHFNRICSWLFLINNQNWGRWYGTLAMEKPLSFFCTTPARSGSWKTVGQEASGRPSWWWIWFAIYTVLVNLSVLCVYCIIVLYYFVWHIMIFMIISYHNRSYCIQYEWRFARFLHCQLGWSDCRVCVKFLGSL